MENGNEVASLYNLPTEILIFIFQKCDVQSLGRLTITCKRFKIIIDSYDSLWLKHSLTVLGSNMSSEIMKARCKPVFGYRERCKISKAWHTRLGYTVCVEHYKKCMPCIVLQKEHFYISRGLHIQQHERAPNGTVCFPPVIRRVPCTDDVSKFVVNDSEIVCGARDGRIIRMDKIDMSVKDCFRGHYKDILAVDSKNDIIISGSKDYSLKINQLLIWKSFICPEITTEVQKDVMFENIILSTAIMQCNTKFVVGTPGTNHVHPLQFYDLERGSHITNLGTLYTYGAGILDIAPNCNNTFYSCGYDTSLRLWDIRGPDRSVLTWVEPLDSSLYCVQTDNNVTIITGTCNHNCFYVWDKRHTRAVKMYHVPREPMPVCSAKNKSQCIPAFYNGPVYDVDFDAGHIYCAFEKGVMEYSYLNSFDAKQYKLLKLTQKV